MLDRWKSTATALVLVVLLTGGIAYALPQEGNLLFNLRADAGVTDAGGGSIEDGEEIGGWADQSANGYNLAPLNAGRRPLYDATGGPGGAPAIRFISSDSLLNETALGTVKSYFAVFQPSSEITSASPPLTPLTWFKNSCDGRAGINLGSSTGDLPNEIVTVHSRNSANVNTRSGYDSATDSIPSDSYTTLSVIYDEANQRYNMWVNGAAVPMGYAGADDDGIVSTQVYMGINSAACLNHTYDGHIAQVVTYDIALDDAERQQVEAELLAGGPPLIPGDANGDGVVDDKDLSLLLANWGQDRTGDPDGGWSKGEFNAAAPIEDADLSLLLSNWTVSGAVPEPASAGLLLAGGVACLMRRRTGK